MEGKREENLAVSQALNLSVPLFSYHAIIDKG